MLLTRPGRVCPHPGPSVVNESWATSSDADALSRGNVHNLSLLASALNNTFELPTVVVMRGVPGSGKSTAAKRIVGVASDRGVDAVVCSADHFMVDPATG
jgi:predicted alpha/beta-fold hydrolase